jgi:hypothetical protein
MAEMKTAPMLRGKKGTWGDFMVHYSRVDNVMNLSKEMLNEPHTLSVARVIMEN